MHLSRRYLLAMANVISDTKTGYCACSKVLLVEEPSNKILVVETPSNKFLFVGKSTLLHGKVKKLSILSGRVYCFLSHIVVYIYRF